MKRGPRAKRKADVGFNFMVLFSCLLLYGYLRYFLEYYQTTSFHGHVPLEDSVPLDHALGISLGHSSRLLPKLYHFAMVFSYIHLAEVSPVGCFVVSF